MKNNFERPKQEKLVQITENKWKEMSAKEATERAADLEADKKRKEVNQEAGPEKEEEIDILKEKTPNAKNETVPENKLDVPNKLTEAPLVPASFKKIAPETKAMPAVETAKKETVPETKPEISAKGGSASGGKPEEAKKLLIEKEIKIADYEKSEEAVKEFIKKNWGVENVPSDLSKWPRSEELKPLLEARDAAKSELEKNNPLYFKEKEEKDFNEAARENFVRAQLELEKVKQAGGYDPEDFKTKKAPFEKSFEEAKKLYYEYLKNNEGSTVEQKNLFISEEFNKLQDIKINLRSEEEAKKSYFPFNTIKEIGNWYRKQSAKDKYIVSAGLIGGGILAGITGSAILAGAVGTTAIVSRILSGAGTAVGLETAIARGEGKKFGMHIGHKGLMKEKTAQEIEKIKKGVTVESAADFFEKNEEALASASGRLYEESKKLETQRALISGAMGAVIATGAFGAAIKNVMHWTGADKAVKNAFDWTKERLGLGGHKVAGVVGSAGAGTERVAAHTQEVHHYVGEVKPGGNITRAAFESGHQAGVSHERIMEAMKHSSVKDIHGNLISLDKTDLVQPGVKLEFIPKGTMINGQPAAFDHFMVIEPKGGGGGFGGIADLNAAKHFVPEVKESNFAEKVAHIEAQFNTANEPLLKEIPAGLKESIINSDKFIDLSRIEPGFDKLDFEHQNNIIKFIAGKVAVEHGKNVREAAVLSEKLYEHLLRSHSYLKNAIKFINLKEGRGLDAGILDNIKDKSINDLYKTIKTMNITRFPNLTGGPSLINSDLPAFERIGDFMKEHGFKEGKEKISEVLAKIATDLQNK